MIRWSNLPRLSKVYLNVRQEMELRRRKQKKKKLLDHDSGDWRRRGVSGGAPPQNNGPPETVIYSAPQDQYHPPHQHMYPMAPSPPCHHMDEPHPLVCVCYDGFGWFFVWKNASKILKGKIMMLRKRVNNSSSSSISYLPCTLLQISQRFKDSSL